MPVPGDRRDAFPVRQLIATFCGLVAVCGGLLALTGLTVWLVAAATQVRHGIPARR